MSLSCQTKTFQLFTTGLSIGGALGGASCLGVRMTCHGLTNVGSTMSTTDYEEKLIRILTLIGILSGIALFISNAVALSQDESFTGSLAAINISIAGVNLIAYLYVRSTFKVFRNRLSNIEKSRSTKFQILFLTVLAYHILSNILMLSGVEAYSINTVAWTYTGASLIFLGLAIPSGLLSSYKEGMTKNEAAKRLSLLTILYRSGLLSCLEYDLTLQSFQNEY